MEYSDAGLESCIQLFYDRNSSDWIVLVPEQTVTGVSVSFDPNEAITMCAYRPELVLVADIHSHHMMNTFFSCIDDSDEKGMRLYGVFGRHRGTSFEIKMRAGSNGDYCPLDPADILEDYENRNSSPLRTVRADVPDEWFQKVSYKSAE